MFSTADLFYIGTLDVMYTGSNGRNYFRIEILLPSTAKI
jgi:hypothetical protein